MGRNEKNSAAKAASTERIRRRAWRSAFRILSPIFKRKYNCSNEQIGVEGPYLLIANHAANSDPILVSFSSRNKPLTFVASEHLERLGILTGLLTRYFSIIPRSKASTAFGTVKSILKALRHGESVLLFAEGDCTWDGVSAKVFPATGKLAKASHVPLVTYRLEGNYLSKPRWANAPRRGAISGRVVRVYSPEELAAMSAEEITEAIDCDIYEDAWATQKRTGTAFLAKAPAEGLEKALFICPECGRIGSLATRGSELFCTECGMHAQVDGSSLFKSGPFPTIREWDLWQKGEYSALLREGEPGPLFPANGRLTSLLDKKKKKVRFSLDLKERAVVIDGKPFPFSGISDMAMVKTNRLLFTTSDGYFEIFTKSGVLRPYLLAFKMHAEEMENE